jgi:hypothetical protein
LSTTTFSPFLRRAERHILGSVARTDVERALREPIQKAGRDIGEEALQIMVDGARGYPFLLQLAGAPGSSACCATIDSHPHGTVSPSSA